MSKKGPEDRMVDKAVAAAKRKYGKRIVIVRYPKGTYSQTGVVDLLVCLDGKFLAAEAKAPDEDMYSGKNTHGVTVLQAKFLDSIEEAGGWIAVFRSAEQFLRVLASLADQP